MDKIVLQKIEYELSQIDELLRNCWDNACAESFFKTLKRELAELDGKTTRRMVRIAIFEYIEVYYNRLRIHSRNGFRPPAAVSQRVA